MKIMPVLLIFFVVCIVPASYSAEVSSYLVEDMGTLGGPHTEPLAINSLGYVAGYSDVSNIISHGMLWSSGTGGMEDLGTLAGGNFWSWANGVNDTLHVVGSATLSDGATHRATLWRKVSGKWLAFDLGTNSGFNSSTAYAINNHDQVVGTSAANISNTATLAMIWNPGSPPRNLGLLGGSYSIAAGINDAGQVVGYASLSGDRYYNALLWLYNGTTWQKINLGTLSGSSNTNSYAVGINQYGDIVGNSAIASSSDAPYHAVLWSRDEGGTYTLVDLGTLGGKNSYARGINARRQVVGGSNTAAGETHATLWHNGVMLDLNEAIPPMDSYLAVAHAINDAGQIVATGADRHAYLLTPIDSAPGAPTGVTATAGNAQATIVFEPPVQSGSSAITAYTATSSPGNLSATAPSSPITVEGLSNGTLYTFTVTATNATGTGPMSAASNGVTPADDVSAHTVLSVAGAGGTISPEGAQRVIHNATTTFAITPSAGYHLLTVTGCGGSLIGNLYRTGAITGDCTVAATFGTTPRAMIGTTAYNSLQAAYSAAPSGIGAKTTIMVLEGEFADDLDMGESKGIFLRGGYSESYSARSGVPTTMRGALHIRSGTVSADRFFLKSP